MANQLETRPSIVVALGQRSSMGIRLLGNQRFGSWPPGPGGVADP